MKDILIEKYCTHQIFDEAITVQGSSPDYFAEFKSKSNGASSSIEVRDFHTTEALTNYNYDIQGMTHWQLNATNHRRINFNHLGIGGSGSASFVDGNTQIYPSPKYLASYRTITNECPRCQGTNIQKDIDIVSTGDLATLEGKDKLRQQVMKVILTRLTSNPFHSEYGSSLNSIIDKKLDNFTRLIIHQSISEAIKYLQDVQTNLLDLPASETILRLSSLSIVDSVESPNKVSITISILSGDYEEIPIGFNLLV